MKTLVSLPATALILILNIIANLVVPHPGLAVSGDGWIVNTDPDYLLSIGVHPGRLESFGRWNVQNNWEGRSMMPKSCLVVKDGVMIGAWYADQNGNAQDPEQGRSTLARLTDNGKALAILLFGAIMQNKEAFNIPDDFSVDSKLYDERWLPEGFPLSDPKKSQITFEHVLNHTSGLLPVSMGNDRGDERSRVAFTVGHEPAHPVSKRLYFTPGHPESIHPNSPYSDVAFNHLAIVFRNLTGKAASELLREMLLQPLGIEQIAFTTETEPRLQPWLQDNILWMTSGGIMLTPEDYAKIGQLLLDGGRWRGEQLVPESWIRRFKESAKYPDILANKSGYWTGHEASGQGFHPRFPEYPDDIFFITGSGLTWTCVIPSKNIVAVRTSRIFSVNEQEVRRQFLDRLYACLDADNNFSIQAGKTMASQVIPDPINPMWLVRNADEDNNQYPDPAFYCSMDSGDDFLYRGQLNEDGTRTGDQIQFIRESKTWEGLSVKVVAVRNNGPDEANQHPTTHPEALHVPSANNQAGETFNQSLMQQWDDWLTALDNNNVIIQFFFYDDPDHARILFGGHASTGPVFPEEGRFIQDIVQRFQENRNIIWSIGLAEEKTERIKAIAQLIRDTDKHRHMIAVPERSVREMSILRTLYPIQFYVERDCATDPDVLYNSIRNTLISTSERNPLHLSLTLQDNALSREAIRKRLWTAVMAGASGLRLEAQAGSVQSVIQQDCEQVVQFFHSTQYFHTVPFDELCIGGTRHLLAATGKYYIAYADDQNGTIGIKNMPAGTYRILWYDISNNQVQRGKIEVQKTEDYLWKVPQGYGKEVALYIEKDDLPSQSLLVPQFKNNLEQASRRTNVAPEARSRKIEAKKNAPTDIQLYYKDPDSGPGPYTITIIDPPKKGFLNGVGNDLVYTPTQKARGKDHFTWSVSDGQNNSNTGSIEIEFTSK